MLLGTVLVGLFVGTGTDIRNFFDDFTKLVLALCRIWFFEEKVPVPDPETVCQIFGAI